MVDESGFAISGVMVAANAMKRTLYDTASYGHIDGSFLWRRTCPTIRLNDYWAV